MQLEWERAEEEGRRQAEESARREDEDRLKAKEQQLREQEVCWFQLLLSPFPSNTDSAIFACYNRSLTPYKVYMSDSS